MKRPVVAKKALKTKRDLRKEENVKGYAPLEFFCYYVRQVTLKQAGKLKELHPLVRDYAYPPLAIQDETVLRFVQQYLLKKVAGKNNAMKMIVMGAFQAPDQPWCFKECLPVFLAGVKHQRAEDYATILSKSGGQRKPLSSHFKRLEAVLKKRYVRGVDPELIKSGKRKGNVHGYGDVGLYHAEHQTSVMPGLTHPEGLRWKLEHWPVWLEKAVLPQIESWPDSDDLPTIEELIAARYVRKLPQGVDTKIGIGGSKRRRIIDLFGNDRAYALSVLSQALLFADILKPADKEYRRLRTQHGLGAGCFTVRGYWMAFLRDRTFKAIDTRTFCPGFTGALKGADATKLSEATGVFINRADNWNSWETQVRFGAWLFALQRHMDASVKAEPRLGKLLEAAGASPPLHCAELEATLCFCSRLTTMFTQPQNSGAFYHAAHAIGENLPRKVLDQLYRG